MTTTLATALFTAQSWILAQAATTTNDVTVHSGNGAIGHGLIWSLVAGLIIGIIAKFLTPGREPTGCIITSLIGIAGSLIAYFIGRLLGFYTQGDLPGIPASIVGAIILLVIYHATIGKRPTGV